MSHTFVHISINDYLCTIIISKKTHIMNKHAVLEFERVKQEKVVMADEHADCPMAHMVDIDRIHEVREQYPDVAVVCYVNSTAEIKAESDVCVTSSNAIRVVEKLPNKHIFFIPDNNLARFVAKQLPEKEFILPALLQKSSAGYIT